jgi:hypothetical protein
MLGFAHREGLLRRIHPIAVAGLFVVAVGLGGWWTVRHPLPGRTYDLNGIPLGYALVSAGAVLVLLRVSPSLRWLARTPVLGRLVTVLNARAMTIYLWHMVAVNLSRTIDDRLGWTSLRAQTGTIVVLVTVAVLALGWVEDLAARRPVQLIPGGRRTGSRSLGRRQREPVATG